MVWQTGLNAPSLQKLLETSSRNNSKTSTKVKGHLSHAWKVSMGIKVSLFDSSCILMSCQLHRVTAISKCTFQNFPCANPFSSQIYKISPYTVLEPELAELKKAQGRFSTETVCQLHTAVGVPSGYWSLMLQNSNQKSRLPAYHCCCSASSWE